MGCEKHGLKLESINGVLYCTFCRKPYEDGFFGKQDKKKK